MDKTHKYRRKNSYELFGAPNSAALHMTKTAAHTALQMLPTTPLSDVNHVKQWVYAAKLCCPVFIDAYRLHSEIVAKMAEIDRARAERLRNRFAVLTAILGPLIQMAKAYMGFPPLPT